MKRNRMKQYHLRRRTVTKNSEGGTVESWGTAVQIDATIWSAGGAVQAEIYGERLAYIKNMEYAGAETMSEKDGVCVYVSATEPPDYVIKAINGDHEIKVITLEKRHG